MFQLSTNTTLAKFKPLVSLVLQGNKNWDWAPVLLARVSMGVFFAISGGYKLMVPARFDGVVKTMIEAGIPFPEFMSAFLASVEFFGGIFLVVGFLSTFCAIALTIAMLVAIVTVEIHTIPKGIAPLDWLSWFLYLPQVMYVLIFGWLIVGGPGRHSVDHYLARAIGTENDKTDAAAGGAKNSGGGAFVHGSPPPQSCSSK
ncbi:MAG: DoxX family protein [Proteobacteria bacterium]|nr:DoxX family protein [Pseudomonadota bacterium]